MNNRNHIKKHCLQPTIIIPKT